ncbi:IS4 family transposase, partial [Acinetobacter pittii]|nr:IS4 family transposase [Acinetobacter pittii]
MNSKSLSIELLDFFQNTPQAATSSAFVQQRSKILPKAFEDIFSYFTNELLAKSKANMPIFAVDGSSIQIP